MRRHLEALLNDFWRVSNLPGAAGSIGGGVRRGGDGGRKPLEGGREGGGGEGMTRRRSAAAMAAWLAAEGGRRESATARLSKSEGGEMVCLLWNRTCGSRDGNGNRNPKSDGFLFY